MEYTLLCIIEACLVEYCVHNMVTIRGIYICVCVPNEDVDHINV